VKNFRSRLLKGSYSVASNTILLNEDLSGAERFEALRHELLHAHFFTETVLGRFVGLFFKKKVIPFYVAFVCLAWSFSPLVCWLTLSPVFVVSLHEVCVSVRVFSFWSLVGSIGELLVFCVLLWLTVVSVLGFVWLV
jgi:hypothetical protein